MNIDHNDSFQCMIDESLAGVLSAENAQPLREHLSTCATCREYLSASNRVIAGLDGFSFEVNPNLPARVMAALKLQAEEGRGIVARGKRGNTTAERAHQELDCICRRSLDVLAGSALVYQMAERLAVPVHFDTAQVQAGVLVFWLLPSLCAAFCLLAAPVENRGIA